MKRKITRMIACILALALTCSGMVLAAGASTTVTFSDIKSNWAKSYIQDMASAGMLKGYDDGTFRPGNNLTAAEALALCSRIAEKTYHLTDAMKTAMYNKKSADITKLLNGQYSWFYDECSVCLELGVLTWTDLQTLVSANDLGESLTKEWFSVYMVRALGVGEEAEKLSSKSLTYADAKDIDTKCASYISFLNEKGIVEGDTKNKFGPKLSLTRAVCAAMLSRGLKYADDAGIYAEAPAEYTDCTFTAGVIKSLTDTKTNELWSISLTDPTAAKTTATDVSVIGSTKVYRDGLASGTVSSLKVGDYVRVCKSGTDTIIRAISSDQLTSTSGTVTKLTKDSITVTADGGTASTYTMNRFTGVVTPSKTGGVDDINLEAGYTNAVCLVDDEGNVLKMTFSGGTYQETGLLSSVATKSDGSSVIDVTGFDGAVREMTVPANATILVDGLSGSLKSTYAGRNIVLYRKYQDNTVAKISLDSVNTYIQGAVTALSTSANPNTITIKNLSTIKETTYSLSSTATATYSDTTIQASSIAVGSFATARVSGNNSLEWISAWPGSVEYTGKLTEIVYGYPSTTLKLTDANGIVKSFALDMSNPPAFLRDKAVSSISELITGDSMVVTVKYNVVAQISSTSQEANLTGVVQSNTFTLEGSVVTVKLTDGTTQTYTITDNTSITQNGSAVSRANIQPGCTVGMVIIGSQVASVKITSAAASASSKLEGTVYLLDATNKKLTLLVTSSTGSATPVTVSVPTTAKVMNDSGTSLAFSNIKQGDTLEIRGSYSGQTFVATIVIVMAN